MQNKKLFFVGMLLVGIMVLSYLGFGAMNSYTAASSTMYDKEELTGAVRADIANISYAIDGALAPLSADGQKNTGFIPRMMVRSAFTIKAAAVLMDEYDARILEETGLETITAVPGTGFNSYTVDQFENYFGGNAGLRYYQGGLLNETAGDDPDSNGTLTQDGYSVLIDYENFDAPGFDGLNASDHENLNTQYQDLTDDLLDIEEAKDDYTEQADTVVAGGFANTESALMEVMKLRVSDLDASKPLPTQVTITNYTLSEAYLEQVMSQQLANDIVQSYDEAKSAGFLSKFKIKSPLKISRASVGQAVDAFKKAAGNVRQAATKTFDKVRGSSAWTNALAFKDNVVKGTVSTLTGIKDKVRTGFTKLTDTLNKIKTGTKKLVAKAFGWFNGLSTKVRNIIKVVLIVAVLLLVAYLIFNFKMITSKFRRM